MLYHQVLWFFYPDTALSTPLLIFFSNSVFHFFLKFSLNGIQVFLFFLIVFYLVFPKVLSVLYLYFYNRHYAGRISNAVHYLTHRGYFENAHLCSFGVRNKVFSSDFYQLLRAAASTCLNCLRMGQSVCDSVVVSQSLQINFFSFARKQNFRQWWILSLTTVDSAIFVHDRVNHRVLAGSEKSGCKNSKIFFTRLGFMQEEKPFRGCFSDRSEKFFKKKN